MKPKLLDGHVMRAVHDLLAAEVSNIDTLDVSFELERKWGHKHPYNTINTVLDRLCKQGYLLRRKEARRYVYTLNVPLETYLKQQFQHFLGQYCNGDELTFMDWYQMNGLPKNVTVY